MLKTDHPIMFDDYEVPFMRTWKESLENVEQLYQTEAGTDDIDLIRKGKLTIQCATTCLADELQQLIEFSYANSFSLSKYNPRTGNNEMKTVRMRDFNYTLKDKSWDIAASNGVWDVSFTLKEF